MKELRWTLVVLCHLLAVHDVAAQSERRDLPAAILGESYTLTLPFRGGEGRLQVEWDGDLAEGMELAAGGTLRGRPTKIGEYLFQVTAKDEVGDHVGPVPYRLMVVRPPTDPLAVSTSRLPRGFESLPFEAALVATGGLPPYRWSVVTGQPPLALDPAGRLHGVSGSSGKWEFAVEVRDRRGDAARSGTLALTVDEGPALDRLRVLGVERHRSIAGVSFETELAAAGGLPPYEFDLENAPDWLRRDGTRLSGRRDVSDEVEYTVLVEDSAGNRASAKRQLHVGDNPWRRDLEIATSSLPAAEGDAPYAWPLRASGGLPPYEWNLLKGPDWLRLEDGVLVGHAPAEVEDSEVRVTVSDSLEASIESPGVWRLERVARVDTEVSEHSEAEPDSPAEAAPSTGWDPKRWFVTLAGAALLGLFGYLVGRRSGKRPRVRAVPPTPPDR